MAKEKRLKLYHIVHKAHQAYREFIVYAESKEEARDAVIIKYGNGLCKAIRLPKKKGILIKVEEKFVP